MSKKDYQAMAIKWLEKRSISNLKAKVDGYEPPKSFLNRTTDTQIQPDISFQDSRGGKNYSEIVIKTENPRDLVTKWKFLSMLASMKNGKLFLLAPKGHKMFAKGLVDRYNINALVYSI